MMCVYVTTTCVCVNNNRCGPCQMISPQVESMAEQYRNVIFIKVDVDQQQELGAMNQVRAMPTFLFFKNGSKIAQFEGADSSRLQSMVLQYDTFENELVKKARDILDHQKHLAFGHSVECLKTIVTLMSNVVKHPHEEKYRSINLANPAIQKRLSSFAGSIQFMEAVGFEKQQHGSETMVLDRSKNVTEQYQDILEVLNQKVNGLVRSQQLQQKEQEEQEKKKKEIEERMERIREEKRRQKEEKQRLAMQTKLDHRDMSQ